MEANSFKPSLNLLDATMIVAGSMIGSGIFIVSADIVRNTGSTGWLMAVWLIKLFENCWRICASVFVCETLFIGVQKCGYFE